MNQSYRKRAPLDPQSLAIELEKRQSLWKNFDLEDELSSTNDFAKDLIKKEINEGHFVLTNFQSKGRGRQDRTWIAPKNSSIFISIILKSSTTDNLGWIPLMAGVALQKTLQTEMLVELKIKWPNDLVIVKNDEYFKCAGILLEKVNDYVIAGIGINFDQTKDDLPINEAESIQQYLNSDLSKEELIALFVSEFAALWHEESNATSWPTPSLVRQYKANCITLGKEISALMPSGESIQGLAKDISVSGELVLDTLQGEVKLNSGDVHLKH